MSRRQALLAALALACPACACAPAPPPVGPGQVAPPSVPGPSAPTVRIGAKSLRVTVLAQDPARAQGWAGVRVPPTDTGLLRVWPRPLFIALGNAGYATTTDVAFAKADGTVVAVDRILASLGEDEAKIPWVKSPEPIVFVLETRAGGLADLAVAVGARLEVPPDAGRDAGDPVFPALPTVTLGIGTHRVTAEVAASNADRRRGLMFRNGLPADTGMLFVYPESRAIGFWMRNCCMAMTVAYIAGDGRIAALVDMLPAWHAPPSVTPPSYPSPEPVPFGLEMERGWFEAHGVKVGDMVVLPPELADWRRRAEKP